MVDDEFHEGPKLDCSAVTGLLGIFTEPETEVEAQLDQVGNLAGFGV